ncbi:uncharacterized protein LOC132309659 [Cornus florida]|uniref:uncharacterized protein LOC132309659 n=1 Tax=Cornus florida TaxID=4283 RepID=UPI0028A26CEE|nr:uncharacterized protein LOC132309659 [Cornus florida]
MPVKIFFETISSFKEDQVSAVWDIGFGNILELKCTHLNQYLCQYLVENFDECKCGLRISDKLIPITATNFEHILGIPNGHLVMVNSEGDKGITNWSWVKEGGFMKKKTLKVAKIGEMLRNWGDQCADDDFKRLFVVYACGCILFPNTAHEVSKYFFGMVDDVEKINQYNWAKCVLNDLVKWVNKLKASKNSGCNGSLPFLKIIPQEKEDDDGEEDDVDVDVDVDVKEINCFIREFGEGLPLSPSNSKTEILVHIDNNKDKEMEKNREKDGGDLKIERDIQNDKDIEKEEQIIQQSGRVVIDLCHLENSSVKPSKSVRVKQPSRFVKSPFYIESVKKRKIFSNKYTKRVLKYASNLDAPDKEILVDMHEHYLSGRQVWILLSREWIDSPLLILKGHEYAGTMQRVFLDDVWKNSLMMFKLNEDEILKCRRFFFPTSNDNHWLLYVIDIDKLTICYLDSLDNKIRRKYVYLLVDPYEMRCKLGLELLLDKDNKHIQKLRDIMQKD